MTLCGLVREAKNLRSLCTFYTGVSIEWVKENKEEGGNIIARCEKKNEELFRLPSFNKDQHKVCLT